MERKFDSYLLTDLFKGDYRNMFYEWDMEKIRTDVKKWKIPSDILSIYILANKCEFRTLHARVGCTSNLDKRVKQHNGIIAGGPTDTRKAAGNWKLIMYYNVPPIRNYSTKSLKKSYRKGRGWVSKCKKAIKIANKKGLIWKISKDVLNPKSEFYDKSITELVQESVPSASVSSINDIFID
jgi:hypothetical protein